MAKRKRAIPQYGTVVLNGIEYYRTRVEDSDGNRVALYAKTPEKLYDKELEALEQIDSTTFRRRSPTSIWNRHTKGCPVLQNPDSGRRRQAGELVWDYLRGTVR